MFQISPLTNGIDLAELNQIRLPPQGAETAFSQAHRCRLVLDRLAGPIDP